MTVVLYAYVKKYCRKMSLFRIDTKGANELEQGLQPNNDLAVTSDSESDEDSISSNTGFKEEQHKLTITEPDDEYIIVPVGTDDESEDEPTLITEIPKLLNSSTSSDSKSKKKKERKELNFDDVYVDNLHKGITQALKDERKTVIKKKIEENSLAMKPGLEQLEEVPNPNLSDHKLRKLRKAERSKTKGKDWFDLPAPEVTEEVKHDLEVIKMRSVLDPKTFYKKNDLKVLPKYFQIGKVADNAADFYHSRIPKKERKRTLVDELLADAEFQQRSKQKFKEIVSEKERTSSRAHRHAKRLKKRKT